NGTTSLINPFTGIVGARWDSQTLSLPLAANDASYSVQVTSGSNQTCLTFAAWWTSTIVIDKDKDGLLDVWERNGLHLNIGSSTQTATFGDCMFAQSLVPPEPCVNLPAMGADPGTQDVFLEIDWLSGAGHEHVPKLAALKAIAQTFSLHGIST